MSVAVPSRVQPQHAHSPHSHSSMKMPANRTARPVVVSKPPPAASSSSSSRLATSPSSSMPPPQRPQTLAALATPGKDTSSSSGKIFAKPSKEWVLPERAKPGRKAATDEPENRRQSQNRLSQRAHRARRTDYIQTLEERLRKYEADEIHSNVRLQEVARALKADNDRMKSEIGSLSSALATAQSEREEWNAERQSLNDKIRSLRTQLEAVNMRIESSSPHEYEYNLIRPVLTPALTPTGPTATPRRTTQNPRALATIAPNANTTLTCPICPDPDPDCPCQRAPTLSRVEPTLGFARCGLCDLAPESCLCEAVEEDIKPIIQRSPSPLDFQEDCGLCTNDSFCACRAGASASSISGSSYVNYPSSPGPGASPAKSSAQIAAPAVALKLRRRPAAKQSVWALDNVPAGTSRVEAVCTGDPSNCDACRNDSFGREFCENLFGKPHNGKKCSGCGPNGCTPKDSPAVSQPLVLACCGAPELCGHAAGCDPSGPTETETHETMRPEEAWRALKAHPNSRFTPLAILADVVARRAKVDGPRVELSPPPESDGSFQEGSRGASAAKRRLAVETSAVREALRLLDSATPEREAKRQRI